MGDVIGTGAQGQVFACHMTQVPSKALAAKVVDSQRLLLTAENPEEVAKKLESEVRILRNVEHEHCVSLFDIYRTKRWIVLVMERLKGGELFEQIAKKRFLKELEAKHVMRQIISGLSLLHGKHIAHRDLKPENILISASRPAEPPNQDCVLFDIKIADYGLSKYREEELKSLVGTPQYWAPEMLMGRGKDAYDERVDLWSLGVLLYVMLYGRYPFKGERANEQIKAGVFDLNHPKNEPSEEAKDLIRKLLKVNANERLSLKECLEHPWLSEAGPAARVAAPSAVSGSTATVSGSGSSDAAAQQALVLAEGRRQLPLDLKQLLKLQMSLGRSLQLACLACRQSHPRLSGMIRQTITQAYMLWQHALKVVSQYGQVAQKVKNEVLPDLNLAVQEAQPDLGVDLLGMVEGWIQEMTADGDTTRRLCDDLAKQMGELISQAQQERLLTEAVRPERSLRNDAITHQADQRRQALLDGLVDFCEQMSKGNGTADEKSQELVELLFMSPGMAAPRSLEPPLPESKSTSSEDGKADATGSARNGYIVEEPRRDSNATPSSGPVSLTPETPSVAAGAGAAAPSPFGGELALRPVGGGPRYETSAAHPLLRALYELHQVSDILRQCTSFWSHIEGTVKELARSKDHAQSLLRYASKSHRLKERFDQRLMEYSAFWASLLLLCDQYCAEVQPALQQMSQFLRHAEVAADFSDALTVERLALQ